MHTPTPSTPLHNLHESIAHGLKFRFRKQGWEHPAVGFLSFDEQGQILADSVLATGAACFYLSPCAALKAALRSAPGWVWLDGRGCLNETLKTRIRYHSKINS